MSDVVADPFFGPCPEEIHLPDAPLVSVICQIRFPEILSVEDQSYVALFQERVRSDYPVFKEDEVVAFRFDVEKKSLSSKTQHLWRFASESKKWRITLASHFVALETKTYTSRASFIDKLHQVVDHLGQSVKPTHITRVGMRYIDQVGLGNGRAIEGMLRQEMVGVTARETSGQINRVVTEAISRVAEGRLLARWGKLPEKDTHDPDNMPALDEPSWFLDIDAVASYDDPPMRFEPSQIASVASGLAARCYTFFRWAVNDEFIQEFGGRKS